MFLKAIEVDPGFGRAWAGLAYAAGYIYLYCEEDEKFRREALDASARALECCDTAEGRAARGVALWLSRDYEAAEAEFRKALDLNPALYEALYLYGRLAHERGDYPKAAQLWQRAATVNSGEYQAAMLLPQAFMAMGQPDKAHEWEERALARAQRQLDLHPDDVRALYLSAVTHAELGHSEEARKAAARALQLEPEDGIVAYNIACMYATLNEPDAAIDLLERAMRGGAIDSVWLEHDATLSMLKGHPRFEALLGRLKG
jgi:adenylate cyclase